MKCEFDLLPEKERIAVRDAAGILRRGGEIPFPPSHFGKVLVRWIKPPEAAVFMSMAKDLASDEQTYRDSFRAAGNVCTPTTPIEKSSCVGDSAGAPAKA